ncbi:Hsp70 family protein [Actinophytocola sp.]|uniref:Hsp70 family protein n=1 Tax=Actinophytocola sp. TaxID=1872138 RepID=UPI002ED47156
MAEIDIGVDFGSTELRVAYSPTGEPPRFLTLSGADWPWLLCEPAGRGLLPFSFPSLKSKLGVAETVGAVAPAEVMLRALETVRTRVTRETSGKIRQTVISVPARYVATQRTALTEAASAAGLGEISLMSDSVAAVIGHVGNERTGTFLVYGMGYSGFEVGLVRAVRGRYRVLGYEGANAPGGDTLDEQVLGTWLFTLRQHSALPDAVRQGEPGWLRLRETADRVKRQLAAGGPVLFPMYVSGPDRALQFAVHFEQEPFDAAVRGLTARTLDRVDVMFEQAGISRDTTEEVLLVGGSTRMPRLRTLAAGLGSLVSTRPEVVALGAVRWARQLTGRSSAAYEEQPSPAAPEQAEPMRDATPLATTVLTVPATGVPAEPSDVDKARQLFENGRLDEATQELHKLIAEAQDLLSEIAATRSRLRAENGTAVDELLTLAGSKIDKGQLQEAISLAHMAWAREASRADVFDRMIEIHCEAAMASPGLMTFPRDENWLRCALQHDPSNQRVRALLAERTYVHGTALNRAGRKDEARRALEAALTWNPDHDLAESLLHRLSARG